jgi:hypothetical protein
MSQQSLRHWLNLRSKLGEKRDKTRNDRPLEHGEPVAGRTGLSLENDRCRLMSSHESRIEHGAHLEARNSIPDGFESSAASVKQIRSSS